MKKGKTILSMLAILAMTLPPAATSAAQNNAKKKASAKISGKAAEYTCVHHPDIKSNAPETCPKCLMVLTKKAKSKVKRF